MEFRRPFPNSGTKVPANTADYIIYGEDLDGDGIADIIYAKNGKTGEVEFKSDDASEVIQYAINNGYSIHIKSGTYQINDKIHITEGKIITGDGISATTLLSTGDLFSIDATSSHVIGLAISDMELVGGLTGTAIYINSQAPYTTSQARIENLRIRKFQNGIDFNCTASNENWFNTISNVEILNCPQPDGYGVRLYNGGMFNIHNLLVIPGNTNDNTAYALYIYGAGVYADEIRLSGKAYIFSSDLHIGKLTFEGLGSGIGGALSLIGDSYSIDVVEFVNVATNYSITAHISAGKSVKIGHLYTRGTTYPNYGPIVYNGKLYVEHYGLEHNLPTIYNQGGMLIVEHSYDGFKKWRNSSNITFTGDGTTTTFSVAHNLVAQPSKYFMQPLNDLASTFSTITADATYLYVNFSSAPPSGSTLSYYWYAEV